MSRTVSGEMVEDLAEVCEIKTIELRMVVEDLFMPKDFRGLSETRQHQTWQAPTAICYVPFPIHSLHAQ